MKYDARYTELQKLALTNIMGRIVSKEEHIALLIQKRKQMEQTIRNALIRIRMQHAAPSLIKTGKKVTFAC